MDAVLDNIQRKVLLCQVLFKKKRKYIFLLIKSIYANKVCFKIEIRSQPLMLLNAIFTLMMLCWKIKC